MTTIHAYLELHSRSMTLCGTQTMGPHIILQTTLPTSTRNKP